MQKLSIELTYEQLDEIVMIELQRAYRMNCADKLDENDDVNEEFLNAIDVVLDYYMTPQQKEDWVETKRVLGL